MLPTNDMLPGLMDALSGGAPSGPPDSIDVTPPDSQGSSDMTPEEHLQAAIDHAQAAQQAEPDSAYSATLSKVVHELYKIQSDQQDGHINAMGGKPKEMRAMHRAYGSARSSGAPVPGGAGGDGGAGAGPGTGGGGPGTDGGGGFGIGTGG